MLAVCRSKQAVRSNNVFSLSANVTGGKVVVGLGFKLLSGWGLCWLACEVESGSFIGLSELRSNNSQGNTLGLSVNWLQTDLSS